MIRIDNFTVDELREIVENSETNKQALERLGYSSNGTSGRTLRKRCEQYNITMPSDRDTSKTVNRSSVTKEDLKENSSRTTTTIKRFILREEILSYSCNNCENKGQWEGKPLILQLDHINGIGNDHRLENLRFLCPNCHSQTETFGSKNGQSVKEATDNLCPSCGVIMARNSQKCRTCHFDTLRRVEWPERDLLKNLIRTDTFTSIMKQFNVTDSTIRSWCKKYNLPHRKKDIVLYSNEEWLKV